MGYGADESPDALILKSLRGRLLTRLELQRVLDHAARAGFDPRPLSLAGGRIAGLQWAGRTLSSRDRLPPAEVHYLRHVVARHEWPHATTLGAYIDSLRNAFLDEAAGVFTSEIHGEAQLAVVAASARHRGPDGGPYILVEYRVSQGFWMTSYQPLDPISEILVLPTRRSVQWLRQPNWLNV